MSTSKRLTEVFKSAEEILFDDSSKFIFFSDCHRGDNSWSDDFADNQNLFFHALNYYFNEGFIYIEIGDGDELWENKRFEDIREAYNHIFWKMSEFYKENRLYLIWGNHNRKWKKKENVKKYLYQYYNDRKSRNEPLFDGIKIHEGLILRHTNKNKKIFIVHGHQGDLLNDSLWWLGKFVVRHIWKPFQILGVKDPTSPAKNIKKREVVEKKIIEWVNANNQMLIAGHTHRPTFPDNGVPPYFNDGSCVHPRCITGIEMQNGEVILIKWLFKPKDDTALTTPLLIIREELAGPKKL